MAKDKPKTDDTLETKAKESGVVTSASPPIPKPMAKKPVGVGRDEPLVSFDRWFRANSVKRGFKPHWTDGMRAYADTSGRRTMSQWDMLFEKY